MIDDPAYSIIERLRREQRSAIRRTSNATSSAPLPTAQWVRAEFRAEMRQLRRPLRTITARNALEWADRLSSLRNQNPQDGAQAPSQRRHVAPARCRRRPCHRPLRPTAEWVRAEYRTEMRQLGVAQRTITTHTALRWAHILSSIRRRREATVRPVFDRMRFLRVAFPLADLPTRYRTMIMLLSPNEQ